MRLLPDTSSKIILILSIIFLGVGIHTVVTEEEYVHEGWYFIAFVLVVLAALLWNNNRGNKVR